MCKYFIILPKPFYGISFTVSGGDDLNGLPWDPAERKKMSQYLPNQRDEVRQKYLTRGPCQPYGHVFQKKKFGRAARRFNPAWFEKYGNWLEYSVSKDKPFCLCCYLFRDDIPKHGGNYAFVTEGFSCWKKPEALSEHVGGINSFHNIDVKRLCDDLMNQGQSIVHAFYKQGDVVKNEYRIRLNTSVDASRYLLRQGLYFRGHDDGKYFINKGNFVELLKYTGEQNDVVSKSADVSNKEQMAVVFRFVDKSESVKERFVGVAHVNETSSLSLKSAVDDLFAKHGLSLKHLRGQGYDGASNMKVHFNGLRALVARENSSAYYISLPRSGNTRWGSQYKTFLRLVDLFPSVIKILQCIQDECAYDSKICQAYGLLKYFHTFDCVFYLQLMLFILGVTENLLMTLQMKNQDISNAMSLVDSTKRELQNFREDGRDLVMGKVSSFCEKHNANIFEKTGVTNLHHYKVNCFYTVMDLQLQEFNDRFTEVNTDLLICMASLSPANSFREFDKSKMLRLVKLYPDDFSFGERLSMKHQLRIYIDNIRNHAVERCFSAMKLVKTATRNQIGDEFLSDCLVCYIKKKLFESVTNETVVKRFNP
ncbi:hypothetical protein BRARA_G00332 [Brassica rapa]|uniref:TTF-type domain-containing protein n=1 Tax=Brassica campestris TaxID=3711 RepID=A0A397YHF2_BRACM|nr:hypothetical protein BRARA_G00332 [Brassica rapa]